MTALELVVVLGILVALASLVTPLVNSSVATPQGEKSAEQIATETSIAEVREVIMGGPSGAGMWTDVGQRADYLPRSVSWLFSETPPFPNLGSFDPISRTGWRGPYLTNSSGRDLLGEATVVDGWGTPLELQVDFDQDGIVTDTEARYARIVSAGVNGVIDTPATTSDMRPGTNSAQELTLSESGDDIVVFLRTADTRQ